MNISSDFQSDCNVESTNNIKDLYLPISIYPNVGKQYFHCDYKAQQAKQIIVPFSAFATNDLFRYFTVFDSGSKFTYIGAPTRYYGYSGYIVIDEQRMRIDINTELRPYLSVPLRHDDLLSNYYRGQLRPKKPLNGYYIIIKFKPL